MKLENMETITRHKDKNGVLIQIGQQCEVYNEETNIYFNGEVVKIKEDFVSVEDMEGDVFDIEPYNIEVELDLRDIAEKEGLDYIYTTSEGNGYPRNLKPAIIGFNTFGQAQEIADKYNLSIESFETKDGWGLWTRNNRRMYEPYQNSAEDYGDNYSEIHKMDEDDFIENEVQPLLEDAESFDKIEAILKEKKEIWEQVEVMEDDEIVITSYGTYYQTIKKTSMYFSHDTRHYTIGLI